MWKSFLNAVVEAFAMFDPVAYMHYIECKREAARQQPSRRPATASKGTSSGGSPSASEWASGRTTKTRT